MRDRNFPELGRPDEALYKLRTRAEGIEVPFPGQSETEGAADEPELRFRALLPDGALLKWSWR